MIAEYFVSLSEVRSSTPATQPETAPTTYSMTETVAGSTPFTLTETGTDGVTSTLTANSVTGAFSQLETGTDAYTLGETGTVLTETVTGVDNYSSTDTGNNVLQTDSASTTGGGTWTRTSSGSGATLSNGNGTNSYTQLTSGDALSGAFSESETGTDRYGLVDDFDDVSNAKSGAPGNITFHTHGLAFRDPNGGKLPAGEKAIYSGQPVEIQNGLWQEGMQVNIVFVDQPPSTPTKQPGPSVDEEFQKELDTLQKQFEKQITQLPNITDEAKLKFLHGVVKGFAVDGFAGSIQGIIDILILQAQITARAAAAFANGAAPRMSGDPLAIFNGPNAFFIARDGINGVAKEFSSEIEFLKKLPQQLINSSVAGVKAYETTKLRIITELKKYFEAKARGEDYKLDSDSELALKYVGLIVAKLGIQALNLTPEQLGRIVGFISYLVVETIALDLATSGGAEFSRPARLAGMFARMGKTFESLGIKAEKITELVNIFNKLAKSGDGVLRGGKTAEKAAEAGKAGKGLAEFSNALQMLEPKCFVAGTPLLIPGGSKAIELFRPGDFVLSRAERELNGLIEPRVVEEVFVRIAQTLQLTVSGRVIGTTAEHPLYVLGKGWHCARELDYGDVLASHNGVLGVVEAVNVDEVEKAVYNIRVEGWHTYFVGCNDWGFSVWAHNADCAILIEEGGKWVLKTANKEGKLLASGTKDDMIAFAKAKQYNIVPQWTARFGDSVAAAESDLGRMALQYRIDNGISEARNVFVVEYEVNGIKQAKVFVSDPVKGLHSEEVALAELPKDAVVLRAYTERTPCTSIEHNCYTMLVNDPRFASMHELKYSYVWGINEPANQTAIVNALNKFKIKK